MTMLKQRQRAGEHQRPEQQQAHRVDVVGLAQLRRRQVLREVEGEHAEEAEQRQAERDHARDHALARLQRAVRRRQAVQLVDRLHVLLPARAGGARRIMKRAPLPQRLRPRPCGSPAGRSRRGRAPGSRPAPSPRAGAGMAPLTIAWIQRAVVAASLLRGSTGTWCTTPFLRRQRQLGPRRRRRCRRPSSAAGARRRPARLRCRASAARRRGSRR